jgi:hypothetical protein
VCGYLLVSSLVKRWRAGLRVHRLADEVATLLAVTSRRTIPRGAEVRGETHGRSCRVTVHPGSVMVWLELRREVVPPGITLEEASDWGPQMQEAWVSGDAVQTGDLDFDLAFMTLVRAPHSKPDKQPVRRSIREALLSQRSQIKCARIGPDGVQMDSWALGRTGQTFPSREDVRDLIGRCVALAGALETAHAAGAEGSRVRAPDA